MIQQIGNLALLCSVLTLMFFPLIIFILGLIEVLYRLLRKGA